MNIENRKTPLGRFIFVNNLKRDEVAQYLGVSPQFVTMMYNGRAKMTGKAYKMLMENDRGWNTAPLNMTSEELEQTETIVKVEETPDAIAELKAQIAAKDEQIAKLLTIISNLTAR